MKKFFSAKKITLTALLSALSLLAFMLESLFPPLLIPGAKLGLGNIFTFLALIVLGVPHAFITLGVKLIFGAIFSGGVSALMYSLPSGLVSLSLTAILIYYSKGKLSVLAISSLSAVVHNAVQLTVYALITDISVFYLMPYLTLIGMLSGIMVGLVVFYIIRFLPQRVVDNILS